jgi:hypothetical protein
VKRAKVSNAAFPDGASKARESDALVTPTLDVAGAGRVR